MNSDMGGFIKLYSDDPNLTKYKCSKGLLYQPLVVFDNVMVESL